MPKLQHAPPTDLQPTTDWVDERELVRRTTIPRNTWQTWRSRGKGPPYYRVGRRVLYKWGQVSAWIEASQVTPKAS